MRNKVGFYYDQSDQGLKGIMQSHEIEEMEKAIMLQKKSEIEAAFFQRFGVPGAFKFSVVKTPNKTWNGGQYYGGRVIFRIIPDDKRTYTLLRKEPGWINQFVN